MTSDEIKARKEALIAQMSASPEALESLTRDVIKRASQTEGRLLELQAQFLVAAKGGADTQAMFQDICSLNTDVKKTHAELQLFLEAGKEMLERCLGGEFPVFSDNNTNMNVLSWRVEDMERKRLFADAAVEACHELGHAWYKLNGKSPRTPGIG